MRHNLVFLLVGARAMSPGDKGSLMLQTERVQRLAPLSVRESLLESIEEEEAMREETRSSEDLLLAAQPTAEEFLQGDLHPLWVFESDKLEDKQAYQCAAVMMAAGILCSAGGIGGGGIYVTVLMVAGGLSVWDAVPLSKSVVFFGSISSLVLNMRKADSRSGTLIDYNVCRLVVPAALLGTYLGVLLNVLLPSWAVLAVLVNILVCISFMVVKTTWTQYWDELPSLQLMAQSEGSADAELAAMKAVNEKADLDEQKKAMGSLRNRITMTDIILALAMLTLVVAGSCFRHHAITCQAAAEGLAKQQACGHPATFWVSAQTLSSWMSNPTTASFIKISCFAGPLLMCCVVLGLAGGTLVEKEGWSHGSVLNFAVMAVTTGCLAGFVGIGGGLIFSPYFLLMGLDPAVAVATSSTCVIFTSSSTTFQYLLTDRIIVSLTLLYGLVNLFASYAGTKLVHCLQDEMGARRSYISGIVSVGVIISTILATRELFNVCFASFQA